MPKFLLGFLASVVAAIVGWITGMWPVGVAFGAAAIFIGIAGVGLMLVCFYSCRGR
jgi:hypothetical protein